MTTTSGMEAHKSRLCAAMWRLSLMKSPWFRKEGLLLANTHEHSRRLSKKRERWRDTLGRGDFL